MTLRSVRRRRISGHRLGAALFGLVAVSFPATPASAQQLLGRVIEEGTSRGVPAVLVRLIDEADEARALSITDSLGAYVLGVPGAGEYRITTEAFGYETFLSPPLAVGEQPSYRVDVEVARAPLPVPGLVVSAERMAALERGLRLILGVSPRSLRNEPILRAEIEDHLDRAHGITDLIRWSNLPSIVTRESTDGPCFQWRARGCIPVYLNGMPVAQDMVSMLPLDMVETIVVVQPNETIAYNGGAILLYTAAWIR